jgi:hypothetical protein
MYNSGQSHNRETIKSILLNLGYQIKDYGSYFTCNAAYRSGSDIGSVAVYDEIVKDFVLGQTWQIKDFLQLVTNQKSSEELNKYLENNNIVIQEVDNTPKITQRKKYPKESLLHIDKTNNSYIINRGISEQTTRLFECGMVGKVKGKLYQRFVWPVFNIEKTDVLGFCGRSLEKESHNKYLIFGDKKEFIYPIHLNNKIIEKTKCVLLTEGIPDTMKLFDIGLKNTLCLFGTELSYGILNYLLRKNIEKIIIVTNNELNSLNGGVGNIASKKIMGRLLRYFDKKSIIEHLPPKKDIMDCSDEELEEWKKQLILLVGNQYFMV